MTLKDLRQKAGLTQEQVAKIIEVDQAAVSNWEIGKYSPVRKYREKLAKLYGCTADEIHSVSEEARKLYRERMGVQT